MNIICDAGALTKLSENEKKRFRDQYDMSPELFIKKRLDEWNPDDLKGKYVVSIEERANKPQFESEGLYCFNILGIYTPREDQNATLAYYGHIAFVDIRDGSNNQITLLYKDDECYPQSFNEWYEDQIGSDYDQSDGYFDGKVPTKEELIELIKLIIIGYAQNPTMQLHIEEDDIIILQGL